MTKGLMHWLVMGAAIGLAGFCAMFDGTTSLASDAPYDLVLHPRWFNSPRGAYQLYINPSQSDGLRAATYEVKRAGQLAWTNQLPFTFREAQISDDGYVIGFAFTLGLADGQLEQADSAGQLIIAILDPSGKIVFQESHARKQSQFLHQPPSPFAKAVHLDGLQQSALVRLADADANVIEETWWQFDLRSGKRQSTTQTSICLDNGIDRRSILHVKSVAETGSIRLSGASLYMLAKRPI